MSALHVLEKSSPKAQEHDSSRYKVKHTSRACNSIFWIVVSVGTDPLSSLLKLREESSPSGKK